MRFATYDDGSLAGDGIEMEAVCEDGRPRPFGRIDQRVTAALWAASSSPAQRAASPTGVFQCPALRLSVGEVLEASLALFGEKRRALVTFEPDAGIEAVFGRFGELDAGAERSLGFGDDGDAVALLRSALDISETKP